MRTLRVMGWLLGVVALAGAPARADKCTSQKLTKLAGHESALLACEARVAKTGDSSRLESCRDAADEKLIRAFAKLGTCGGQEEVCSCLTHRCATLVRDVLPGAGTGACEAKRLKAAASAAKAELRCSAKAARKGAPVDGACIAKAQARFARQLAKADACAGGADLLDRAVDQQCVSAVGAAGPGGVSLEPLCSSCAGPTVHVAAQVTEDHGNPLTYEWRVTDGTIESSDGPAMTWTLPPGPGLHFAYVLASNGKGGYAEQRVAVSTDEIGPPVEAHAPLALEAPAAPPRAGEFYRSVLRGSGYYTSPLTLRDDGVYIPDGEAYLGDAGGPKTAIATSDVRGYFTIPEVPDGTYDLYCRLDPSVPFDVCSGDPIVIAGEAAHDPFQGPQSGRSGFTGRLLLADGTPCGTVNEFFGKTSVGRATLLDGTGATLAGPLRVNAFGHYAFSDDPAAASILLECEGAAPVTIPATPESARILLPDTSAPIVTAMSLTRNGVGFGIPLPPPSGLPSDDVPGADFFLTFKGIDSRMSACRYYVAIGAAASCDAEGNPVGAVRFDDWKRAVRMAPFLEAGAQELTATYINRVDLDLTRNHHSVSYGPDQTAAYVCNHLGPKNEGQAAADVAIDDAVHGRNLVACVAMDHGVTVGVNGDQPFTRFLIFGPSGELLPSVNLDGRREKFVPGVCVACHGGDHYAGRFPEEPLGAPGAGPAGIGAHFLPYDTGNFTFSTAPGLTEADQEEAIYALNQNVLLAGPTVATQELIQGWYAGGHVLDKDYLPASWAGAPASDVAFYHDVYARSCRTCHVAFTEALNFDHYVNLSLDPSPVYEDGRLRTALSVCGGSASWLRSFSMPNSLRTLNLFWSTAGGAVDEPAVTNVFSGAGECAIQPSPEP
jgi:hypothetical protein